MMIPTLQFLAYDGGVGEYLVASLIISALATTGSILYSLYAKPKPKNQFDGIHDNTITRGGFLTLVIGRRAIGCHIGWVGDRVTSKSGGGKGGGAPAGTTVAEGGWHQLCPGPIRVIHRIWAGNRLIWRAPLDFSTLADGSLLTLLNDVGQFRVYSGRDNAVNPSYQPADAYLSARTGVISQYPGLAHIVWQRCGLGSSTSWPQFKYEIEVRPDDLAAACGLDMSWCPVPTWMDETTPAETSAHFIVVWLNGKQSIPAGTYKITYLTGAFRLNSEAPWIVHYNNPNTHIQIVEVGGAVHAECPGNNVTYPTQEAAELANAGANATFTWPGGPMGIAWSDIAAYPLASSGTPCPTYSVQLASGGAAPTYVGAMSVGAGAAGSGDSGANPMAALFILLCAPFPYGCGIPPSSIDLTAMAAAATTLAAERLAVNILAENGKQMADVIGSLLTDIGMLLPQVGGKLTPYLVRTETVVPTITPDLATDPPEENRQHAYFNADRYTFQIEDALADFSTGDVSIDDDAQALFNQRPQTQSIQLENITSRAIAMQVGNRRWLELAAQAHKLPTFKALREVRDPRFHCGRAFLMNGTQYRVVSWKPDTKGVSAELEALLDQYGDTAVGKTPGDLGNPNNQPPAAPPAPDLFFLPLIIPRSQWPSPTVPDFGVGRVRANHSIVAANVWISTSPTGTYDLVGNQNPYSAGGPLLAAFNSTPGLLVTGPNFTPLNDDVLEVPDLTGDTAGYNAGLLLVACEQELMLLESITANIGGDYTLNNVTRGAFGTTVAAHAIGVDIVIIQRLQLSPLASPLLAANQGGTLWVKTQPTDGNSFVDLSLVTPEPLLVPINLLATITITAPAGSPTVPIGATYNITWRTSQLTGNLKIEYSSDGGATWSTLAASVADTGSYAWNTTGLTATIEAEIRVSSVLTPSVFDVTYPFTLAVVTAPVAPTLVAVAGEQMVDLSWTAVGGATAYNIKRSLVTGGPYTTIATLGAPAGGVVPTTYIDGGLTNGTAYFYVVSAILEGVAESADSNEATATPFHCDCGAGVGDPTVCSDNVPSSTATTVEPHIRELDYASGGVPTWFDGGANFSAGKYSISYITGALNYGGLGSGWQVSSYDHVDASGMEVAYDDGASRWPWPDYTASGVTNATQAAAWADNAGGSLMIHHTGGRIGMKIEDASGSFLTDNCSGTPSPTFKISAPLYTAFNTGEAFTGTIDSGGTDDNWTVQSPAGPAYARSTVGIFGASLDAFSNYISPDPGGVYSGGISDVTYRTTITVPAGTSLATFKAHLYLFVVGSQGGVDPVVNANGTAVAVNTGSANNNIPPAWAGLSFKRYDIPGSALAIGANTIDVIIHEASGSSDFFGIMVRFN